MAKNLKPIRTYGTERVLIEGTVAGGTGTCTNVEGAGYTVSYVDDGKWRITLLEKYAALVKAVFNVHATTQSGVKGYTVHSAGALTSNQTLDFWIYDAQATPVLVQPTASQFVSFSLTLRATAVTT